jgi:hypothetical protein
MAEKEIPSRPAQDPLSPRIDDGEVKSALSDVKGPDFEPDAFLRGASSPAASTEKTLNTGNSKPKPEVVRRGGIGFFTALVMSSLATVGGASLAVAALSRPDLLKQVGLGGLLPAPVAAPSLGTNGANLAPLSRRIDAIEAELIVLKAQLEGKTGLNADMPPAQSPQANANPPAQAPGATAPNSVPTPAPNTSGSLADVGLLKSELAGIGGRVTAMETRLAALDPTGSGGAVIAGLQADIASLKSMVSALQQQVAAAPSPAVTFAMVNLAEAANRSTPFLTEYETLRAAMPNTPEVAGLEAFARSGVPTRALLQERFSVLGPALAASAESQAKEGGFMVWLRSLFSDMVKVKPAASVDGTSNEAILARAKTKLDQGDLSASVEEVSTITNPPTQVREWLNNARARLNLESRIAAVRGAIGRVPAQAVPAAATPTPAQAGQTAPTNPTTLPSPASPPTSTNPKT